MSDLAEFTQGTLPRLSNVVARLEKRGWVRRTPDPADGRYTLAILTGPGWAKVAGGEWTATVGEPTGGGKMMTLARWRDGAISEEYLWIPGV